MKTFVTLAAVFGLSSLFGLAQDAKPAAAKTLELKRISAAEAEKHYDQTVIVTGKVAQISFRPKVVYLNLDKRFPNAPMSCVIFSRATNQFGDLKKLEGKQVEVKGRIEEYQSKAQMILNSSNQLKVIDKPAASGDARQK